MSGFEEAIPYIAAAIAGASYASSMTPSASAPPPVVPVTPMPLAGDANAQLAKRRSIADQLARQGRASTILSGDGTVGNTLG